MRTAEKAGNKPLVSQRYGQLDTHRRRQSDLIIYNQIWILNCSPVGRRILFKICTAGLQMTARRVELPFKEDQWLACFSAVVSVLWWPGLFRGPFIHAQFHGGNSPAWLLSLLSLHDDETSYFLYSNGLDALCDCDMLTLMPRG